MDQNKEDYDDGPVLRWRWPQHPPPVDYGRLLRLSWQGPVLVAVLSTVQFVLSPLFPWRPTWGWFFIATVAVTFVIQLGIGYLLWRTRRPAANP